MMNVIYWGTCALMIWKMDTAEYLVVMGVVIWVLGAFASAAIAGRVRRRW